MSDRELDTLEQRLAQDREAMAETLGTLANTVAVAPERFGQIAEGTGDEIRRQVVDHARENPAAFALAGAGLALLLTGTGASKAPTGRPAQTPATHPGATHDSGANRALPRSAAPRPSARQLRAAVDAGLDRLGPKGRQRVLRARHKVIRAQMEIERRSRKALRKGEREMRRQPFATAALAFGVGAVVAALTPMTRRENELMGAQRDALMDEAEAALARELEAAGERLRPRTVSDFDVPS